MEQGKALSLLRKYKNSELRTTMPLCSRAPFDCYFKQQKYSIFLCEWLSESILQSNLDPIVVIKKFRNDMELILGESDDAAFITHDFSSTIIYCTDEILRFLTLEDKK